MTFIQPLNQCHVGPYRTLGHVQCLLGHYAVGVYTNPNSANPLCSSVRLSVCPSVRLSVCPSVRLSIIPLSLRIHLCSCLSVCPSVCRPSVPVCSSICPRLTCPFVPVYLLPSACPSVRLSAIPLLHSLRFRRRRESCRRLTACTAPCVCEVWLQQSSV